MSNQEPKTKEPTIEDLLHGVTQRNEPIPSGYLFDPRQQQPLSRRYSKPAEDSPKVTESKSKSNHDDTKGGGK